MKRFNLAIFLVLMFATAAAAAEQDLPWQITTLPDGGSRVFGLTLGQSTLEEANAVFHAPPDVAMFETPGEPLSVEAYYGTVTLHGLSAKVVVELALPPKLLAAMRDRAVRRRATQNGVHKLTLVNEDLEDMGDKPIASITYIPSVNLDANTIIARFGKPAERVSVDPGTSYWLYPAKGLAVAVPDKGRKVLQYVAPRDFARIRRMLTAQH